MKKNIFLVFVVFGSFFLSGVGSWAYAQLPTEELIEETNLTENFSDEVLAEAQAEALNPELLTEEMLEAKVTQIFDETKSLLPGSEQYVLSQKLELLVTKGSLAGETLTIETGDLGVPNAPTYQVGDQVMVSFTQDNAGGKLFYISDYVRRDALIGLLVIFLVLTLIIARKRGVFSVLGMVISFAVIFMFVLPRILSGDNPVLIAILGSMVVLPATFFLSHGVNKKTLVAISGTLIALVITGLLAITFVQAAKLTGFSTEEAGFLSFESDQAINMQGLLLAGIIIGVLGVLDDITVSQSAIVFELKSANPKLGIGELYRRAMGVGQDHIASMVNTLVLVYTGASLPLLLLFVNNPRPISEIFNYELIADEVVRTLVGSIGLILAVPITT
ncbi:MAG TPA: YibE/F family protein, partial [Candidatus Woesebacteria bacterium]|nr:YibE/F family protein [Candidatus Woesebacteria bacterium]